MIYGGELVVNLLHLCETMTTRWLSEEQIPVPINTLKKFATRNNLILKDKFNGYENKRFYHLVRSRIPVYFISGPEQKNFRFMDISDLHIGHPCFDESALRERLRYAVRNNIKLVFIAGDVFEGVCTKEYSDSFVTQVSQAFNIFKDYPLTYYAINGNHDYSFEQVSLPNPIKTLSHKLQKAGIDFHFFDVYLMDFVICGVIKRVMHLENYDYNKKHVFAKIKVQMFNKEDLLSNSYRGRQYPVRFFQVGHIHDNDKGCVFYAKKRIFISQPGSFIKRKFKEERANVIKGRIVNQKIYIQYSI